MRDSIKFFTVCLSVDELTVFRKDFVDTRCDQSTARVICILYPKCEIKLEACNIVGSKVIFVLINPKLKKRWNVPHPVLMLLMFVLVTLLLLLLLLLFFKTISNNFSIIVYVLMRDSVRKRNEFDFDNFYKLHFFKIIMTVFILIKHYTRFDVPRNAPGITHSEWKGRKRDRERECVCSCVHYIGVIGEE